MCAQEHSSVMEDGFGPLAPGKSILQSGTAATPLSGARPFNLEVRL